MSQRNIDNLVDNLISNSELNNTRNITLENQSKVISIDKRFHSLFNSMIKRAGVNNDEVWVEDLEDAFKKRIALFYKQNKIREQQEKIDKLQEKANGYNTLSSYQNLLKAQRKLLNSVEAFESGLKTAILRKMKENKIDYGKHIEENKEKIRPKFEQYSLLYPHLTSIGINLLRKEKLYNDPIELEKKLNSNNPTEVNEAEKSIDSALEKISTALHDGDNEIFKEDFLGKYDDDFSDLYAEFAQIAPWKVAMGVGGDDFEDIEETLKELAEKGEKNSGYEEYINQYEEFKKNKKELEEIYKIIELRAERDEGIWGDTLETLKVPLINILGGAAATFKTQKELLLSEDLSIEEKNRLIAKLTSDNGAIIEKMNILKQSLEIVKDEKDLDDGHEFMKTATKAMTALGMVLPRIGIISSGIMGTSEGGVTKGLLDVGSYIPFIGNGEDFRRAYEGLFGDNIDNITGEKISFSEGLMYAGTGILGLTLDIVGTALAVPTGGASLAATTAGKSGLKLLVKKSVTKVVEKVGTGSSKQLFIKSSVEGTKATLEKVISKKAAEQYFNKEYRKELLESIGVKFKKITENIDIKEGFKKTGKIGLKGLKYQWEGFKEFGSMLKFWEVGEDFKNLGNLLKMGSKGAISMFRGADIGSMKEIINAKNIDLEKMDDATIKKLLEEYSDEQFKTTWTVMKKELLDDTDENVQQLAKTMGIEISGKTKNDLIDELGNKDLWFKDNEFESLVKAMKKNAKKIENYKTKYNINNPVDDLLKNNISLNDSIIKNIDNLDVDGKNLGEFSKELLEQRKSLADFTNELRLKKGDTISKAEIDAYAKHKWNEFYNTKYETDKVDYTNFDELIEGKRYNSGDDFVKRNEKLENKKQLTKDIKNKEKELVRDIDKLEDLEKQFQKELKQSFEKIQLKDSEKQLLIDKGFLDNNGKIKNIDNIKTFEDFNKKIKEINLELEKDFLKQNFLGNYDIIGKEEIELLKDKKLLDNNGNLNISDLDEFKKQAKLIIERNRKIEELRNKVQEIGDVDLKNGLEEIIKDEKPIFEIVNDLNSQIIQNKNSKIAKLKDELKKEKDGLLAGKDNLTGIGKIPPKSKSNEKIKKLEGEIKELGKKKNIPEIENPKIIELKIPNYKKEIFDKEYIKGLSNKNESIKNLNKSIKDKWEKVENIKKEIEDLKKEIEKLDKKVVLNDMKNLLDKNNFERVKGLNLGNLVNKDMRKIKESVKENIFKDDIKDGIIDGHYIKDTASDSEKFMAKFYELKYTNPEPKYIAQAPKHIEELKNIDDAEKLIPIYQEKIDKAFTSDNLTEDGLKELLENRKKLSALEFMRQNPELRDILVLQKKASELKKAIKNNEPRTMVLEANRIAKILNDKHITNDQLMAWINNYGDGKGDGVVIASFLEDLAPFIDGTKKVAKTLKKVGTTTASGTATATEAVGEGISKTKKAWELTKATTKFVTYPLRFVWNNKGWTVFLATIGGGAYAINEGVEYVNDTKEKIENGFSNIFGGGNEDKKEEISNSKLRKNLQDQVK